MTFKDRSDAGHQVGLALKAYGDKGPLVLGIPRGGVEVAYQAARLCNADFSILIVRKLPFPDNPEAGFGALAEDGSLYLIPDAERAIPRSVVENIVQAQRTEVRRRVEVLREGRKLPSLAGRNVVLVDDGIAMGSTTQAAVLCCRNLHAAHITVAAPVASPRAVDALYPVADRVIALHAPDAFRAVAAFYQNWYDVPDDEVIRILRMAEQEALLQ